MKKLLLILILIMFSFVGYGQQVTKFLRVNGDNINTGNFLFLADTMYISSKKAIYLDGDTIFVGSDPIGVVAINGGLLLDNTTVASDGIVRYDGTDAEIYVDGTGWVLLSSVNTYKEELVATKTVFSVGFILNSRSVISFNGTELRNNQWSGIGTNSLTLALDTEQYDFLLVIK